MGFLEVFQYIAVPISLLITAASFLIAAISFFKNSKISKVNAMFNADQGHRQIWSNIFISKKLDRVFSREIDLKKHPITQEERAFFYMLFVHASTCQKAMKEKVIYSIDGFKDDWKDILTYPIPLAIWNEIKSFQDKEFVELIESLKEDNLDLKKEIQRICPKDKKCCNTKPKKQSPNNTIHIE